LSGPGRLHEAVQRGPTFLRPREAVVGELLDDGPAPLGGVGTKGSQLKLRVLVRCRTAGVQGDLHRPSPLIASSPNPT
jgi:hypothetical protein